MSKQSDVVDRLKEAREQREKAELRKKANEAARKTANAVWNAGLRKK